MVCISRGVRACVILQHVASDELHRRFGDKSQLHRVFDVCVVNVYM